MKEEVFDYSKLRGKIKEVFNRQGDFAKAIEIGSVSLSKRLNNSLEFTQKEINKSCSVLGISPDEIPLYFFVPKVQKHEQNSD